MRFVYSTTILGLGLAVILAAGLMAPGKALGEEAESSLTVQVRELELRQEASFLSPVITVLRYGDQVTIISRQGEWAQVSALFSDMSGWAHMSGLTEEELDLNAGQGSLFGGADSDEVALAGKGFNQAVEAEHRSTNPGLRYDWIDWMEAVKVSPEESQAFLTFGEMAPDQESIGQESMDQGGEQ